LPHGTGKNLPLAPLLPGGTGKNCRISGAEAGARVFRGFFSQGLRQLYANRCGQPATVWEAVIFTIFCPRQVYIFPFIVPL
jgi:hypothetical protein